MKDPKNLKPDVCPFCGVVPVVHPTRPEIEGNAFGQVRCENEDCPAQPVVCDDAYVADDRGPDAYKALAIALWNRRSPPGVETEGQIAALEKMLERASKIGSSRQLNDLIPEMRALLSTSSRGEDLSSRDKRASLPASDGRLLIAAHTKGQWFVADNDGTTGYGPHDVSAKLIRTDGGYVVAAVMTDTKDLRESTNAELLAGAPDLWDALQSIAANTCCKPCQEAALVARSALAKIGAPIGSQASE